MSFRRIALATFIVALASASARADVKLPGIFVDHMVLQRDMPAPIWGWADPGEQVSITAGEAKASTTADGQGKWSAKLPKLEASFDPMVVEVKGAKNTISIKDVLIGDVWVCTGQSNMEFELTNAHNAKEAVPQANDPGIRMFVVSRVVSIDPKDNSGRTWTTCTPETAAHFSAVGYFFGKDINAAQHVPIGLIGSYWGGTQAQAWTSEEGLKADPSLEHFAKTLAEKRANFDALKATHDAWNTEVGIAYRQEIQKFVAERDATRKEGKPDPVKPQPSRPEPEDPLSPGLPSGLYNGMISPIQPYGIKGVIWYQGESNAGAAMEYRKLFPAMIADWRKHWGQGDFPFIFVQLANYAGGPAKQMEPVESRWAALREAQTMTLKASPNTAMAVIIDVGQAEDIHPKDKADVGHRLALAARKLAYGEGDLVASGPMYDSMKVDGDKVTLTFASTGGGLKIAKGPTTRSAPASVPAATNSILAATPQTIAPAPGAEADAGTELRGFAIAGADQKFVWANAKIEDGQHVVVWSDKVPQPAAVRYGWADFPPALNLYNAEGLPASPFRTDDWASGSK